MINRPTIDSAPATSAGRPETAVPKATSCWPVSHISSCAQAPCSTVLTVVWCERASSLSGPRGLLGHPKRFNASPPQPQPVRRADQGGGVKAGQHLAPGRVGGIEVSIGQPGDKPAIRHRPRAAAARNSWRIFPAAGSAATSHRARCGDWSAQTGAGLAAVRINATRKAGWSARSQTAARSAAHTRWICSSTSTLAGVQLDIPPGRHGIGRDDLHRLVELCAESGRQVGMAVDHRVHRIAQPVRVEGPVTVISSCTAYTSSP